MTVRKYPCDILSAIAELEAEVEDLRRLLAAKEAALFSLRQAPRTKATASPPEPDSMAAAVLDIVLAAPAPTGRLEIEKALRQRGLRPGFNSVYTIIGRLCRQGLLRRAAPGLYTKP